MDREVLYLGRDNTIDVQLKADGSAQDLSGVTHMMAIFSGVTFTSVGRETWFDWTTGPTGVLYMKLSGATGVMAGIYNMELIVFDTSNTSGVHWGVIPVVVKD